MVWARNVKEYRPNRCWVRSHGFQEPWPPLSPPLPTLATHRLFSLQTPPASSGQQKSENKTAEEPWTQLYYFSSFISLSWNWNQRNRTANVRLVIFCFKNWQIPLWILAPLCFHFTGKKARLGGEKLKGFSWGVTVFPHLPPHIRWTGHVLGPTLLHPLSKPAVSKVHRVEKGFPGGSVVKNLPATQETQIQSLGQKEPQEKEMATHSSILACRVPWREEPGGLQSTGSPKSQTGLSN